MDGQSQQILAKFDLAAKLVAKAKKATSLSLELEGVRTRFALTTGHIYLRATLGGDAELSAREEFARVVSSENFIGDLDKIVARAKVLMGFVDGGESSGGKKSSGGNKPRGAKRQTKSLREAKRLAQQYSVQKVDCTLDVVEVSARSQNYDVCPDCGETMGIIPDTSELSCPKCGQVRELIGTVFDDSQFYNQEGQKAKSGSFNPNRHFRFWMDHILARESAEELGDRDDETNRCGESLLAKIRALIKRDNKILRLLTVNDVRGMIKELGRSDLNKNVALIMKKLTGAGPPSLSEALYQRVEKLFSKAIEIGEQLRTRRESKFTGRDGPRTNRNHYPYYIYKILDWLLPEDDMENRRVLYYIYMQGDETISSNDKEWRSICGKLNESGIKIEWVATNRAKADKYRPG